MTPQPQIDINQYHEAVHVKTGGRKKSVLVIGVVAIVIIVLAVVFVSSPLPGDLPSITGIVPISTPVSSPQKGPTEQNAISKNFRNPERINYAVIDKNDSFFIVDIDGKKLSVSLDQLNWSNLQFSPNGKFISTLKLISGHKSAYNLAIYTIEAAEWKDWTVYDDKTGGVTGYFWLNDSNLLFTQDGWLHNLNIGNGQLTKLSRVDSELYSADIAKQELIFKRVLPKETAPAITEVIPDPNDRTGKNLIENEISPAVYKYDQQFIIADLNGRQKRNIEITDLNFRNANRLILRSLHFTDQPLVYLAESVRYNPANGQTGSHSEELYWITPDNRYQIPTDKDLGPRYLLIGRHGAGFAIMTLDASLGSKDFGIFSLTDTGIKWEVLGQPFTVAQIVQSADVTNGQSSKNALFSFDLKENIRGIQTDQKRWQIVDSGKLVNLQFADDYKEMVYYNRFEK